ncbi:MAG: hypothetical protein CME61_06340 [Halobacteriovoraceae bacterium]|nr:hypothetical protein [Halobacteriovoraceae bacterium]
MINSKGEVFVMKFFIFIYFFMFSNIAFSKPKELMNSWEIQRYKYKESGVYDLKFDIEIEGQAKQLSETKKYGSIKNLSYTVYWYMGNKVDIVVNGLDGKWYDLRSALKSNLYGVLEVIFPTSLFDITRGYDLTSKSSFKVYAEDKSLQKPFREMWLSFSKVGALEEIKSKNALGTQILTFYTEKSRQLKNNFLIKKIVKKNFYGPRTINTVMDISWKGKNKQMFPSKINVKTNLSVPADKKDRVTTENRVLNFSNYFVNKDKAKIYFTKK